MAQDTEVGALKRKGAGLVSRELYHDRRPLWQCPGNVKGFQLEAVFGVNRRDGQLDVIPLLHLDRIWRKLVLAGR